MAANYQFVEDVTIPDNTELAAGAAFVKTWRVRNTGDVAWGEGFTLRFDKGTPMTDQPTQPLPVCAPGETVEVSLTLTAPADIGRHFGDWYFYDASGKQFGEVIYFIIMTQPEGEFFGRPNSEWVADLTMPDDTVVPLNAEFDKIWRIRNTGNIPWTDDFQLAFIEGNPMAPLTEINISATTIGGTADITIPMVAPDKLGMVYGDWRLKTPKGAFFGEIIHIRINAQDVDEEGVNSSTAVDDVTIPDDTEIEAGKKFTKTWLVRNSGTVAWGAGYTFRFIDGNAMTPHTSIPLPAAQPGDEVQISVELTAPDEAGTHYCDWKMHDDDGVPFGDVYWARIKVPKSAEQGSGKGESGSGATGGVVTIPKTKSDPYAGVQLQAPAPFWSQRDPRWVNDRLGNHATLTIGQWGCMMTCNAMIASYKGHTITPQQFNNTLRNQDLYYQGYLTPWNAASLLFPAIKYDGRYQAGPDLIQRIDASLQRGIPVMVNVDITPQNAYNSNMDQHWVVVVSRYNNDYLINDPYRQESGVISLMQKYGRSTNRLEDSIIQAIFYS